jgi:hemolysin activation/secretion protein
MTRFDIFNQRGTMNMFDHQFKFFHLSMVLILACFASQSLYAIVIPPEYKEHAITRIDPARVIEQKVMPEYLPEGVELDVRPAPRREMVVGDKEKAVKFKLSSVVIEGSTVYTQTDLKPLCTYYFGKDVSFSYTRSDFKPLYAYYLGEEVTLFDLQQISNAITNKYHRDGFFLSRAVLPPQKIDKGIVHILVIEGYVDQVVVSGHTTSSVEKLLKAYGEKIKQFKPLNYKDLEQYVLLMNDLPGISVRTVLLPSKTNLGATTLTFVVEQKRVTGNLDYNNYGSRYLGPYKADVGLEFNGLMGADSLTLEAMHTLDDEMGYFQVDYRRPIGTNGLMLNLGGEYTLTHPGDVLESLDIEGKSRRFIVSVNYPVIRSRAKNLLINFSFEWLDTQSDMLTLHYFEDNIRSLRAKATYDFIDSKNGINFLSVEFSQGLPIFGAGSSEAISRVDGEETYTKVNFYASHLQPLPNSFSALLSLEGQYAFQPLLSSEEFGFGGRDFGRGYYPSEITGDSGLAGILELRFTHTPGYAFLKQVMYYLFCDAGIVWNKGVGEEDESSKKSVGAGVRLKLNRYLEAEIEYAKPLDSILADDFSGYNSKEGYLRFNISANLR